MKNNLPFLAVGLSISAIPLAAQPAPKIEPRAGLLDREPRIRDSKSLRGAEFVRVRGEYLERDGQPVRYWGAQGNLIAPTHADIDHEVAILKASGYNLHRLASAGLFDLNSNSSTTREKYQPGDNSSSDRLLYLFAACGRADIDIWMVALGALNWKKYTSEIAADPATPAEWKAAIAEMIGPDGKTSKDFRLAAVVDPRLRVAWKNHIRQVLNTVNPYTGLRLADDPHMVTWEISNEMWWVQRILWGNHLSYPKYFQDQIQSAWQEWLLKKYGSQAQLQNAWGTLLTGESLTNGKVLMLPLNNRSPIKPDIVAYGVDVRVTPSQISGEGLSPARGRDVRAFLSETLSEFKADLIQTARAEGRIGMGISVAPIVADTEFNGSTISLWQNNVGSGTTPSNYHDLSGGDPQSPRYPWYSGLNGTPLFNDWFDDKRVRGKPTLMYEGMIWQPQKYRAEFPWRMAAQGAVQNYSIIDYHYYGHPLPAGSTDQSALGSMSIPGVTTTRLPDGLIYRMDPVLTSTMHAAGIVFRNGYLKPAPNPVTYILGKKSLESFENKADDMAIRKTAFQKGFRYDFDPNAENDRIEGNLVDAKREPKRFSPTQGLAYDTRNGRMFIDVPQAKVVVGFLDNAHSFEGGVKISGIQVKNPEGMPYVIPGERYGALSLVSVDGKPLDSSSEVLVTAANTAWNGGFKFDASKRGTQLNDAPALAKSMVSNGKAPLLEGRVGCVFEAQWIKGKTAIFTNRFGREIGRETLKDGRLVWSVYKPIYEVCLKATPK